MSSGGPPRPAAACSQISPLLQKKLAFLIPKKAGIAFLKSLSQMSSFVDLYEVMSFAADHCANEPQIRATRSHWIKRCVTCAA